MSTTGLRELRQQASEIIRQAEAGETITVTVSGREVAQLGPVRRNQWRLWPDVQEVFRNAAPPGVAPGGVADELADNVAGGGSQ